MERNKAAERDREPTHDHGGRSEQDARIAGEHGWGYGGRPLTGPDGMTPASGDADREPPPDATEHFDARAEGHRAVGGRTNGDAVGNSGELAPRDLDGHHPDWRR